MPRVTRLALPALEPGRVDFQGLYIVVVGFREKRKNYKMLYFESVERIVDCVTKERVLSNCQNVICDSI